MNLPTWGAIITSLVTKQDLGAAASLNNVSINFARAVGPAIAGAITAVSGSS